MLLRSLQRETRTKVFCGCFTVIVCVLRVLLAFRVANNKVSVPVKHALPMKFVFSLM